MAHTEVTNLATGEEQVFTCPPVQAVIAAHAQEHNDYNTWDYLERYADLVVLGRFTVACGDFCALREGVK